MVASSGKITAGVAIPIIVLIIIFLYLSFRKRKPKKNSRVKQTTRRLVRISDDEFEADALFFIHNKIIDAKDLENLQKVNQKYNSKRDINHLMAIRNIQIFSDSIRIALNSKNRDTAESRFKLAVEKYHIIISKTDVLTKKIIQEMKQVWNDINPRFLETMTVSIVTGNIDKVVSSKTKDTKMQYLNEALLVIEVIGDVLSKQNIPSKTLVDLKDKIYAVKNAVK